MRVVERKIYFQGYITILWRCVSSQVSIIVLSRVICKDTDLAQTERSILYSTVPYRWNGKWVCLHLYLYILRRDNPHWSLQVSDALQIPNGTLGMSNAGRRQTDCCTGAMGKLLNSNCGSLEMLLTLIIKTQIRHNKQITDPMRKWYTFKNLYYLRLGKKIR